MRSFTLIAALLLCSLSLVSLSMSDSHTVEVHIGEEVTLMCANVSKYPSHIFWFKLVNGSEPSCISSMLSSYDNVSFCDGFRNGKYEMSSNVSMMFLTIKNVASSDSGPYFCGGKKDGHPVFESGTYLKVQVKAPDGIQNLTSKILAGVIAVLVLAIIVLVVKIRKLQTVATEERHPQGCEVNQSVNVTSDDPNYGPVSIHPEALRSRIPASDSEMEPHVVYAAPR